MAILGASLRAFRARVNSLGLQRRIMLYVALGLAAMFGVGALLGLDAIQQATDLVYKERLATAETTASIFERDFDRLAAHVREEATELGVFVGAEASSATDPAATLLHQLQESDPSPFFRVSGIWLVESPARIAGSAGSPAADPGALSALAGSGFLVAPDRGWTVLKAQGPVPGAQPFAAIYVSLGSGAQPGPALLVHTVSTNVKADYVPAALSQTAAIGTAGGAPDGSQAYHLEVVDPDGVAILGIGPDERPGERSPHAVAIATLVRGGKAAALLHQPLPSDPFEPHVMAAVPLAWSPFYVVLEQPVDVALALPLELRSRLLAWIAIGFVATLVVAWVTTRRVVKPTEQLTAAAERMAQGDLGSPISINAQDEVGILARSLELMRVRLKDAYEAVEETNRELEARVAERTARLGEALRQTIGAQEDERHRLARELHDETAQSLAALSIALDRARDSLRGKSGPAADQISAAREIAARQLAETRRLILGLRPAMLDDLGLVPAVRWHCETSLVERGIVTTVDDNLGSSRLPSHVEVALFRIVQEAVGNVARHAEAKRVRISLTRSDGSVTVVVRDDGRGFDVERALGPKGRPDSVGLLGMQERVALLNGTMQIQSAEGTGTVVTVQVPIPSEET